MAITFQPFRGASQRATPDLASALAMQSGMEQDRELRERAMRSQNMLGAAALYNQAMGDKTPIADFLSGALRKAAPALPAAEAATPLADAPMSAIATPTSAIPSLVDAPMSAVETPVSAVDAATIPTEAATDAGGGIPVLSTLKGAAQLTQGDVAGAAKTGAQAYLATLGPYGIAASVLLGLLGSQ